MNLYFRCYSFINNVTDSMKKLKSIDLFAGIGGMRLAFEKACKELNIEPETAFYSEINNSCREVYNKNFKKTKAWTDIKLIPNKLINKKIPNHDILLAGFPCQPFSQAGVVKRNSLNKSHGFNDKNQGNLFFNILDIISIKKPKAFLLENVKHLANYNKGKVLKKILSSLRKNYFVPDPKILNARDFGLAQKRERIYIVGFLKNLHVNFEYPQPLNTFTKVEDFLEKNIESSFTISDKLWDGHQKRRKRNKKMGKGFGYKLTYPSDSYTRAISARYYKDGGECLIYRGKGKNPRKLTPRECFNLQGFPKSFKINKSNIPAYKQAGNSVPINVVKKILINVIGCILKDKRINDLAA